MVVTLNVADLRPKLDADKLFVDFNLVRTSLTVKTIAVDLGVALSVLTEEGECRGKCPKCARERSFALNVNKRFKCFAKGCGLKGGGAIDFFAKLNEVTAKEASHLLACAYGIQPYSQKPEEENIKRNENSNEDSVAQTPVALEKREVVPTLNSPEASQPEIQITPQHLIASIEHYLAELKQLLTSQ